MDVTTMPDWNIEAVEYAINELPTHAAGTVIHARDYTIGLQCAAQFAASHMFKLWSERSPKDQLKDLIEVYERQYGDGLQAIKDDLNS